MALYQPSSSLLIAEPCHEDWDTMPGDARARHCAACNRDVLNVASMTPAAIEAHITAARHGAPMPCMRVVHFPDGSVLTAAEDRKPGWIQRGAAAFASALLLTTPLAAQRSQGKENVAILSGRVVLPDGKTPVSHGTLRLEGGKTSIMVQTAADGTFTLQAAPGKYHLTASANMESLVNGQSVVLHAGTQRIEKPIALISLATAGIPPLPREAIPTPPVPARTKPTSADHPGDWTSPKFPGSTGSAKPPQV